MISLKRLELMKARTASDIIQVELGRLAADKRMDPILKKEQIMRLDEILANYAGNLDQLERRVNQLREKIDESQKLKAPPRKSRFASVAPRASDGMNPATPQARLREKEAGEESVI